MPDLKKHVGWVRLVGVLEGLSFILLMGVAVPMKYLAGNDTWVPPVGMAHGVLFIFYGLVVLLALINGALSFRQAAMGMIASLLPLGPFLLDKRFAAIEAQEDNPVIK